MHWSWSKMDLDSIHKNGRTVFSCFSCGGGSSFGYKLAGYEVLGNVELDHSMNECYIKNHHPRFNYCMDIRDFKMIPASGLPAALLNLDILDGSPPCSTFSLAGRREEGWGEEKKFREGQKAQRLDDLFFEFIEVAKKLQPKVVIAENVKGLIIGNAKGYLNEIIRRFREIGYEVQVFQLNAAQMGVPQTRERVFIVCRKKNLSLPDLSLRFCEKPIPFGEVRSAYGIPTGKDSKYGALMKYRIQSDKSIDDINFRVHKRQSGFTNPIVSDNRVCPTLTSNGTFFRMVDGHKLSNEDMVAIQTFPRDYDFRGQSVQYVCGMSVPPIMMGKIAEQIYQQWFTLQNAR